MMDKERCKKLVMSGYHSFQCSRKIWKDGYCKQHHPDSVKARQDAANRRYEEKRKNSAWGRLEKKTIQVIELKSELRHLADLLDAHFEQGGTVAGLATTNRARKLLEGI
jgi:hypothetical protein